MTPLEQNALRALVACSFPKRTWHVRFVREVWSRYLRDLRAPLMRDEERALWRLCWRYRAQLRRFGNVAAVLAEAEIRQAAAAGAPLLDFSAPPAQEQTV